MKTAALRLRPYAEGDAARVASFFAEVHAVDESIAAPSQAAWRAFLAGSNNHGGRDFVLAESKDGIVGIVTSTRLDDARHFRIMVRPEHRRRGVARALLREVERQDPGSPVSLRSNCRGIWEAGRAFLAGEGFEVVHTDLLMHRASDGLKEVLAPAGYELRPYAGAADHAAWAALNNEAFAGGHYFVSETAESVVSHTEAPGFGLWMATWQGRQVGYCHVEHFGDSDGLVHSLAITAEHRGRGVGRALLACGARELHRGGRTRLELCVSEENARARALYVGAGFVAYDAVLTHERSPR